MFMFNITDKLNYSFAMSYGKGDFFIFSLLLLFYYFLSFLKWMVDREIILNFLSKPKANRVLTVLGMFSHCISSVEEIPKLLCSNSGLKFCCLSHYTGCPTKKFKSLMKIFSISKIYFSKIIF